MLVALQQKKERLDSYRPFPDAIIQNLNAWFDTELTYTSNAIEGNTLTRAETSLVIEKGLTVGGKPLKDHLEATNHQHALTFIKALINNDSISTQDILSIHHLILKGVDDTFAGVLRNVPVRIAGSTVMFPNPQKLPQLMQGLEDWLQDAQDHPIDKAIQAHYQFVTIHPFVGGNGRTARLLMNLILIKHGYPPIIVSPKHRLQYINGLEKAQLGQGPEDYTHLMYKLLDRSLNIYLKAMTQEEHDRPTLAGRKLLKIGELSKKTNIPISSLRHWIKIGLVEVSQTTPGGYQLFEPNTLDTVERIIQLKKQRFSLEEILEKLNEEPNE